MVLRQTEGKWRFRLRSDQLPRAVAFLHGLPFAEFARTQHLGAAPAGHRGQPAMYPDALSFRALVRSPCGALGCAGFRRLAGLRVLRTLFHPRTVVCLVLHDLHVGGDRAVAGSRQDGIVGRGGGTRRNDPEQGDLHHPRGFARLGRRSLCVVEPRLAARSRAKTRGRAQLGQQRRVPRRRRDAVPPRVFLLREFLQLQRRGRHVPLPRCLDRNRCVGQRP